MWIVLIGLLRKSDFYIRVGIGVHKAHRRVVQPLFALVFILLDWAFLKCRLFGLLRLCHS